MIFKADKMYARASPTHGLVGVCVCPLKFKMYGNFFKLIKNGQNKGLKRLSSFCRKIYYFIQFGFFSRKMSPVPFSDSLSVIECFLRKIFTLTDEFLFLKLFL